jgi:hypothetical protein
MAITPGRIRACAIPETTVNFKKWSVTWSRIRSILVNRDIDFKSSNDAANKSTSKKETLQVIRRVLPTCAAHIGMGGVKIKKEPRQRDEYVYRIS